MYFAGKIAFHNLFNAPARTTLTCLAIITAATMVAWTVASYDGMLTENEPKRAQKMLGKYDFVVLSTATLTETDFQEQLTAITELAEVDFFQAIRVNVRTVAAPDQPLIAPPPLQGLPRRTYQVLGTSAASAPLAVQAGGWLGSDPANAATSCVLTLSLSQQLNVTVGDSLAVGSFAGSFVLQVIGILADAGASDRQTQELWGRVAAGFSPPTLGGLFVRPTAAARIAGGRPAPQFAAGTLKPGQANAEVLNRLSAKPVLGVTCEMLSSAAQAGKTVDSRVKMQSWTACSIALLLSFFIIFSSLSMGVEERSRQCGLLRAVALSRWQVC